MISLPVTAWGTTMLVSAALDMLAKPNVAPWRHRTARAGLLHMASVTWLYIIFLSLSDRAWFALVCTVGLLGLLIAVNNAKFVALREPVVFSDLALFAQSIRHPRLYFPYLSWFQLVAVVPILVFFALTFWFDSKLNRTSDISLGWVWLVLSLFPFWLARGVKVTLTPERDQAQHGFFCVFVTYLLNGLNWREIRRVQAHMMTSPYANIRIKTSDKSNPSSTKLPDVIVIQSESFFDIRRTGLNVAPSLLRHFDALKQSGICSGTLAVPAWGANTMRTEHAFLSGLENTALGYARFFPYAFVTRSIPAMPHAFQARGYRCTAVHPYPSDFFMRHKVFPRLGFDEFVDETHFVGAEHDGPYVSDSAVTDWLIKQLDQPAHEPQFIFAITMECHGPFHLEKANHVEANSLYQSPHGPVFDELTVYLHHLNNADKMLGRLQDLLVCRQREAILCFYGDHVPGMGHVYDAMRVNPQDSDYLIWSNQENTRQREKALEACAMVPEQLGLKLTQVSGVM